MFTPPPSPPLSSYDRTGPCYVRRGKSSGRTYRLWGLFLWFTYVKRKMLSSMFLKEMMIFRNKSIKILMMGGKSARSEEFSILGKSLISYLPHVGRFPNFRETYWRFSITLVSGRISRVLISSRFYSYKVQVI